MNSYNIIMSPAQWAGVPDNPIQRDTQRHAERAKRAHLRHPSPVHRFVSAARLPDGKLVKLDGHTRSLLWQTGELAAPPFVCVTAHDVEDLQEAAELYKTFDASSAAENASDKLSGAYRSAGFTPRSALLTSGGITSALKLLNGGPAADIYEAFNDWLDELRALDGIDGLTKRNMPASLIAAALLTIRVHLGAAREFWIAYAGGAGTRVDGVSDGIDELMRTVERARAARRLSGNSNLIELAARAVSCVEAFANGRTFRSGARAIDLSAYIAAARRAKRVNA